MITTVVNHRVTNVWPTRVCAVRAATVQLRALVTRTMAKIQVSIHANPWMMNVSLLFTVCCIFVFYTYVC